MTDRSLVGWETVAEWETDLIASDSEDGKKIRRAEKKTLNKQKSKKYHESAVGVSNHKASGQQFWIDGEYNGFTPLNQQNFNFRLSSNNFAQSNLFRRVQWSSSCNIRSENIFFGCGERGHGRKYCPNYR